MPTITKLFRATHQLNLSGQGIQGQVPLQRLHHQSDGRIDPERHHAILRLR